MLCDKCGRDLGGIGWCPLCGFDRTAGPLMTRHKIDGHDVLLPADAVQTDDEKCPKCNSDNWPSVNWKDGKPYSYCTDCDYVERS